LSTLSAMDVLVMNHSFEHDIAALRSASPEWDWRVVNLDLFAREATRVMGAEVTEHLGAYARPHLAERRQVYRQRLASLLEDLYLERPFDAFVAPSDSYFYLRDAPAACASLGVPFLVVQKETTIAPWNMEVGTAALREHAPLVARHMTVCSERHREYWERSGAPREQMTVTGQPRFDFYADMPREQLGYGSDGPIILFFSYLPDFYHPGMVGSEGTAIWQELLDRTEEELWALAAEGYRVIVKPHPLQSFRVEERRIRPHVGELYGTKVFVVDGALDVRRLIAGSDVAVGFQSTVMIEAMVAGLPTLYTCWDPECRRIEGTLTPYHEWDGLIDVVRDADRFADVVRAAEPALPGSERWAARRRLGELHLGSLDGRASERTVGVLAEQVAAFRRERGTQNGVTLSRKRPSLALRRYRARERAISTASRMRQALRV
jgi:hypothetical protein